LVADAIRRPQDFASCSSAPAGHVTEKALEAFDETTKTAREKLYSLTTKTCFAGGHLFLAIPLESLRRKETHAFTSSLF
jgi:hypothetical protein